MLYRRVRRQPPCWAERLERRVLLSGGLTIDGVQPAGLDQPQVHAFFRRGPNDAPLPASASGISSFDVQGYLDTGTSDVLLSQETAQSFAINNETFNGQTVTYSDVGIAGSQQFNVSEPLYTALAPFQPTVDADNINDYQTVYSQTYGPLRIAINTLPAGSTIGRLDVFGTPVLQGKVLVMDPKPLNDPNNLDYMRTYIYNPGTPYNPQNVQYDPGIPPTQYHVKLSYGSFDRFTMLAPAGAAGPTTAPNPFIGPDPVSRLDPGAPPDPTPPIVITEGTRFSIGSFLLDTGAASSFISQAQAANVHVHYQAGTYNTVSPVLLDDSGNPVPNQFTEQIGGIGGSISAAGFYLDSLVLQTVEGVPIRFVHAPVLVADVTSYDPATKQSLTLDGDFGMNFLVASTSISGGGFGGLQSGPFDWVTLDQSAGVLGLQPAGVPVPQPAVVGRHVFYNHSAFDGNDPAINSADDAAIATDKQALRPGGAATFANYTSYSRGINGIMVDVSNLPSGATPTLNDFSFAAGNSDQVGTWAAAPPPSALVVRPRAGDGGSTRVEITWPDGAIKNDWLQVTVKADASTGLTAPDVFYFGNEVAESGKAPSNGVFAVTSLDEASARQNPRPFFNPADVTNPYDYNRDGKVDATDQLLARSAVSASGTGLKAIAPAASPAVALAARASSYRTLKHLTAKTRRQEEKELTTEVSVFSVPSVVNSFFSYGDQLRRQRVPSGRSSRVTPTSASPWRI